MENGEPTEFIILLYAEACQDGTYFLYSPQMPLFTATAPERSQIFDIALPIIKETLERNMKKPIGLRQIMPLAGYPDDDSDLPPAYLLAEQLADSHAEHTA